MTVSQQHNNLYRAHYTFGLDLLAQIFTGLLYLLDIKYYTQNGKLSAINCGKKNLLLYYLTTWRATDLFLHKKNEDQEEEEVKDKPRLGTKMCPLPNQAFHQEPSI